MHRSRNPSYRRRALLEAALALWHKASAGKLFARMTNGYARHGISRLLTNNNYPDARRKYQDCEADHDERDTHPASLKSLTFAGTRSVLRTNESVIGRSTALAISCANDLHDNKRLACDTIQYNSQFKQVLKPQTLAIGTEYRVDTYCRRIASDWREKSMTRNDTTRKSTLL